MLRARRKPRQLLVQLQPDAPHRGVSLGRDTGHRQRLTRRQHHHRPIAKRPGPAHLLRPCFDPPRLGQGPLGKAPPPVRRPRGRALGREDLVRRENPQQPAPVGLRLPFSISCRSSAGNRRSCSGCEASTNTKPAASPGYRAWAAGSRIVLWFLQPSKVHTLEAGGERTVNASRATPSRSGGPRSAVRAGIRNRREASAT